MTAPTRGTYAPSRKTATLGSTVVLLAAPMPRMARRTYDVCAPFATFRFGVTLARPSMLTTLFFSSVSPEKAATEIGTSCTFSDRFCAVMTMSVSLPLFAAGAGSVAEAGSAGASAGWAAAVS